MSICHQARFLHWFLFNPAAQLVTPSSPALPKCAALSPFQCNQTPFNQRALSYQSAINIHYCVTDFTHAQKKRNNPLHPLTSAEKTLHLPHLINFTNFTNADSHTITSRCVRCTHTQHYWLQPPCRHVSLAWITAPLWPRGAPEWGWNLNGLMKIKQNRGRWEKSRTTPSNFLCHELMEETCQTSRAFLSHAVSW